MQGSGEDIEGTADDFFFAHQTMVGDGQIIARVQSLQGGDPQLAEAGIIIRQNLDGGSKHVFLAINGSTNLILRRRLATDASSVENTYSRTNLCWLRLMRMGNTFIAFTSTNRLDWNYVGFTTVDMTNEAQVGSAVTAHQNGVLATARIDKVSVGALSPLSAIMLPSKPKLLVGGESWTPEELQRVGGIKFLLTGPAGDVFTIKRATDVEAPLSSWSIVETVTNTFGVMPFLDTQALTNDCSFYRAEQTGP